MPSLRRPGQESGAQSTRPAIAIQKAEELQALTSSYTCMLLSSATCPSSQIGKRRPRPPVRLVTSPVCSAQVEYVDTRRCGLLQARKVGGSEAVVHPRCSASRADLSQCNVRSRSLRTLVFRRSAICILGLLSKSCPLHAGLCSTEPELPGLELATCTSVLHGRTANVQQSSPVWILSAGRVGRAVKAKMRAVEIALASLIGIVPEPPYAAFALRPPWSFICYSGLVTVQCSMPVAPNSEA